MSAAHPRRRLAGAVLLGAVPVGVVLAASAPAFAHVTVSPTEHAANGYTVATFAFGHGCEESPTTEIAISIPEEILGVTPALNANWEVEKVMEPVDPPATGPHGEEITERVSEVIYTANEPVADGYRDSFELSFFAPDLAGEPLDFPVIQSCEEGSNDWIEIAEEGAEEPESPAPRIVLVEAAEDGHGGEDDEAAAEDEVAMEDETAGGDGGAAEEAAAPATTSDDDGNGLAIAGVVLGGLGLLTGGAALATTRRKA